MRCSRRSLRRASGSSIGVTPAVSATSTRSTRQEATPVAVTNDAAIDWSPVWSPDGRVHLFLERPRRRNESVEDRHGRPRAGDRRRAGAGHLRGAGVRRASALLEGRFPSGRSDRASRSINPAAIPFDPVTLRAGSPARSRHAEQRPPAERRLAGRQTDRVFQHRRTSGGHLSSVPRGERFDASPTTRRAIAAQCSRRTGDRSSSIRIVKAIGGRGRSASMAAVCARSFPGGGRRVLRLSHRKVTRSFLSADDGRSAFTAPGPPAFPVQPTPLRGDSVGASSSPR